MTLIEYDVNLVPHLRKRVPHARIIQGDALVSLLAVRCDVLLSNLPSKLTAAVVGLLPGLHLRVALVTVPSIDSLTPLQNSFTLEVITALEPADFRPRQSARVELVKVKRRVPVTESRS